VSQIAQCTVSIALGVARKNVDTAQPAAVSSAARRLMRQAILQSYRASLACHSVVLFPSALFTNQHSFHCLEPQMKIEKHGPYESNDPFRFFVAVCLSPEELEFTKNLFRLNRMWLQEETAF